MRFAITVVATLVALASHASAQESAEPSAEPRFGARHQWLLGGGLSLSWRSNPFDSDEDSTIALGISPTAMYFVTDHFALGATLLGGVQWSESSSLAMREVYFGGALPIAWHVPLAERLFLFPTLRLGAVWTDRTFEYPYDPFDQNFIEFVVDDYVFSQVVLHASLELPLGIELGPWVFVAFGPYVLVEHGRNPVTVGGAENEISVGLQSLLGFWID